MTGVVSKLKAIKFSHSKKYSLSSCLLIINVNYAFWHPSYFIIVFISTTINFNI